MTKRDNAWLRVIMRAKVQRAMKYDLALNQLDKNKEWWRSLAMRDHAWPSENKRENMWAYVMKHQKEWEAWEKCSIVTIHGNAWQSVSMHDNELQREKSSQIRAGTLQP